MSDYVPTSYYDEDIKSSLEKEKEARRKQMENMKLRREKNANQDIQYNLFKLILYKLIYTKKSL